jgi:hypothetical protein
LKPSSRRQLTFAALLLAGLFAAGAAVLGLLYWRVQPVREVVDGLFPRHRGVLVATVGIPLARMRERSSLPISAGFTYDGSTSGVFTPFFDWQVPGTSLHFRGCRFGGYGTDKSGVIDHLEVSVSPRRLRWGQMVEELRATRDQLTAGGFVPGSSGAVRDDVLLAEWLARKPPAVDVASTPPFLWFRGDLQVQFFAEQQESGRWVQRVSLARRTASP